MNTHKRPLPTLAQAKVTSNAGSQNFLHVLGLAMLIIAAMLLMMKPSHANEQLLGGRAFTPPGTTIAMGEEWPHQSIKHETQQPVDLAVALDQQLYPALGPMIEDFAKKRGLKIAVQNGTCGISAGLLAQKAADMGGFCCAPGLTDRLPGLKFHTIGIGSLALITNQKNAVEDITIEDARRLFGNDIRDWSELPMSGFITGKHSPVRAIARLHCKIRPGHWRLILDTEQQFGWDLTEVSAIKDMVKQVSDTPGAIGYETLWHIERLAQEQGSLVKTLLVNGAAPSDNQALAHGKYPLYRVFNITTWEQGPAHNALGDELAAYLVANANTIEKKFAILPASTLRKNGWAFEGNELIGAPH